MRHCIIMTAYKDVNLINLFIKKTPMDWGIFIHLDRKSKISIDEIDSRAVVVKKNKVYWGGWEHLYSFWELLGIAESSDKQYDYYHLVTGQDYFATSPCLFDEVLGNDGYNYIETHSIPRKGWWEGGEQIFQYRTLASFCDIRGKFARWLNIKLTQIQKLFCLQRSLPKIPLYSGIVYSSLHKDFVKWMLHDTNTLRILNSLKNTTLAEEVFFQTIIMNSPYKEKCAKINLRYMDWETNAPELKILSEEDLSSIIRAKALFCRKIDEDISSQLLKQLSSL